jgi:hypothetical protein
MRSGEISPTVEADAVATIMIATLEGALMLTQLYGDPTHLQRAQEHLDDYVERLRP